MLCDNKYIRECLHGISVIPVPFFVPFMVMVFLDISNQNICPLYFIHNPDWPFTDEQHKLFPYFLCHS